MKKRASSPSRTDPAGRRLLAFLGIPSGTCSFKRRLVERYTRRIPFARRDHLVSLLSWRQAVGASTLIMAFLRFSDAWSEFHKDRCSYNVVKFIDPFAIFLVVIATL